MLFAIRAISPPPASMAMKVPPITMFCSDPLSPSNTRRTRVAADVAPSRAGLNAPASDRWANATSLRNAASSAVPSIPCRAFDQTVAPASPAAPIAIPPAWLVSAPATAPPTRPNRPRNASARSNASTRRSSSLSRTSSRNCRM